MATGPTVPTRLAASPPALLASLRQLVILRAIAAAGQAAAIAAASFLGAALPIAPMAAVVASVVALDAWTWRRLRSAREASHGELAAHLAFDLLALAALLFLSGGAFNPFSLLLVLHAVLMALLLPPLWASIGAGAIAACFVALASAHVPLAQASGEALPFGLIAIGYAVSFTLTVTITASFVARIAAELRDHERRLNEAAQRALRDESVLRVGALAAGAAHELSTPLTTMAVVAGEILRNAPTAQCARDAELLASQVALCRESISNLLAAGGHARAVSGGRERLGAFLDSIAARARALHPQALVASDWKALDPAAEIFAEEGLRQTLLSLLDNAIDASPGDVSFCARCDGERLRIEVADRGNGLPEAHADKLGRVFFTTKPPGRGTGLGLVLSARAIERLGGSLAWEKREGGGTRALLSLPLDSLRLAATP